MIDLDKNGQTTQVSQPMSAPPASFTTQSIPQPKMKTKKTFPLVIILFLIVAIGGFYSGAWLKAKNSGKVVSPALSGIQATVPQAGAKVGDIYGSADEAAFKDSATGVLQKGGFNGEGTHNLLRAGGKSQTVYLTSSTIDLDSLVGDQITVWGQTFKGQKVSWLMDVGRAKVEVINAPLPN